MRIKETYMYMYALYMYITRIVFVDVYMGQMEQNGLLVICPIINKTRISTSYFDRVQNEIESSTMI